MKKLFVFAAAAAFPCHDPSAADGWGLKISDKAIKVTGTVLDPLNFSGLASVKQGEIIAACDELKHGVQTGHLDMTKGEIHLLEPEFSLLADTKKELDLEAAAADPEHHRYYVCGSCSVSRKSGKDQPDRQWLFRVETNSGTGALLNDKITRISLKDAMKTNAFLAEHMDRRAADQGIDIEGMAFKEGRLWFGLRSPNVNGWGFVVAAPADDLMAKKGVIFERFELPLGEDLGIRDIVPVKDGFLFIAGPTGAREKDGDEKDATPDDKKAAQEQVKPAKETVAKPAAPGKETVAKPAAPAKETVAKPAAPAKETVAKPGSPAVETVAKPQAAKETVAKPGAATTETVAKPAGVASEVVAKPAAAKETVAKPAMPKEVTAKPAAETVAKPVAETVAKVAAAPSPTPQEAPPGADVFALFFWAGDTNKPVRIGDLPRLPKDPGGKDQSGKPEGLLVIGETDRSIQVLMVSDGCTNGAPVLLDITKRPGTALKPVK